MYIDPAIFPINKKKLDKEVTQFICILDASFWKSEIRKVERQIRSVKSVFYNEYLKQKNPLLVPLDKFFTMTKLGNKAWKNKSKELFELFSISFTLNRIYKNLSPQGKSIILGKLRSRDIKPLLFEIQKVSHLSRHGFEVEFNDLNNLNENNNNLDFLIKKHSLVGEIECKRIDVDTGSRIKRDKFYLLSDEIVHKLKHSSNSYLIEINTKNVLTVSPEIVNIINKYSFKDDNRQKQYLKLSEDIECIFTNINIGGGHSDTDEIASIIKPYWTENSHFAIHSTEIKTLIIKAQSAQKDDRIRKIRKSLKEASNQLSGNNPALVGCFIDGIPEYEWKDLLKNNPLQEMTSSFLLSKRREHIHTISYESELIFINSGSISELMGNAARWINTKCKFEDLDDPFCLSPEASKRIRLAKNV